MQKIRLGEILENAVRLCGRDVTLNAVPADWKVLSAMTLNEGLRRIAAEKFPMMWRIESRRYRPNWDSSVTYAAGHQVWHKGDYWQLDAAAATGEPGVAAGWRKLAMTELPAFIGWEQPWENTVIDRGGVDFNRFAYAANPHYYPNATPIKCAGMSSFGIELTTPAPKEVYVRFVPRQTRVSFNEWTSGTLYQKGDVVYLTASKDVYVCLKAITEQTKTISPAAANNESWQPVRVSDEFEPFLTRLVAADLMTESQGKFQTAGRAENEFAELQERYHEGNGEVAVRRGRFC